MQTSKQIVKSANIIPKLRLGTKVGKAVKSTGPHHVRFLKDKEIMGHDSNSGKEVPCVRYLVEERMPDGSWEHRFYQTKKLGDDGNPSYLVQRLADVPEGGEVILEMKKRGIKNYVEVREIGQVEAAEVTEDDHGAPESVIEI